MSNATAPLVCAAILSLQSPARAQPPQTDLIQKAVSTCVATVHSTRVSQDQSYLQPFFNNFDAYYNPATGLVSNNAQSVGDFKALFVFQKCMAEMGFPLK